MGLMDQGFITNGPTGTGKQLRKPTTDLVKNEDFVVVATTGVSKKLQVEIQLCQESQQNWEEKTAVKYEDSNLEQARV